jgi:multiple sugar transport system permease protein
VVLGGPGLVGAAHGADRRHLAVDVIHVHRALAAIENQSRDQLEAARLDGASGFQIFRDITWPAIAPIAATVVLSRLIEAFKIVDIPNVLTAGGPGLATESITLHSFIAWRTQDLGGSAAIGYLLLFVSTITCVSFFNYVSHWTPRYQ